MINNSNNLFIDQLESPQLNTINKTLVGGINEIAGAVTGLQNSKQDKITSENKLNADLVDDTNSTNKFISQAQVDQIATNAQNITSLQQTKQDKITSENKLNADLVDDSESENKFITQQEKNQIATNTQDIEDLQFTYLTITLNANSWVSNEQTISISTITGTSMICVSATPTVLNKTNYMNAGILATTQGNGTLTFSCLQTPSVDISVNLIINNAPNSDVIASNGNLIINATEETTITQIGDILYLGGNE